MEAPLRKLLKKQLSIGYGQSSRDCEAALKSSGHAILRRCSDLEKADIKQNGRLPEWLSADALRSFCWSVLVALKRVPDDGVQPPLPEEVPSKHACEGKLKNPNARAFDHFCWLHSESLQERAKVMKATKQYGHLSLAALLKKAGGEKWKKLPPSEKEAHRIHATATAGHERSIDGKLCALRLRVPESAPAVPDSAPVLEVPDTGGSAASGGPATVEGPDTAEPAVTPKKLGRPLGKSKMSGGGSYQVACAVFDRMKQALGDNSTPKKEKKMIGQALQTCIAGDSALAKKVKLRVPGFRSCRFSGRPRGSARISDQQLRTALEPLSHDSSMMHTSLLVPIRTLACSKTRAARSLKMMSKTHLCRRIARCRLGYAPFATQRGRCDACQCWMAGGRKLLKTIYIEGRAGIAACLPGYWSELDKSGLVDDRHELEECDSVEYHDAVLAILGSDSHMLDERQKLTAEKQLHLEALEATMTASLENHSEEIKNYNFHLALKNTLEVRFADCWSRPAGRTLYWLWDHMVLSSR